MVQVAVYPGTPGSVPPFHHAYFPSRGVEFDRLEAERTGQGYRMIIGVPFSAFVVGGGLPRRIGFDLAVNTADRGGRRIAQYLFAGGPDNHRNASNFRGIWLR